MFRTLRFAAIGELHVTPSDLHYYMWRLPMTRVQLATSSIAAVIGLVIDILLAWRWKNWPPIGLVFFPSLFCGWWVGRWIAPPRQVIPGHCPRCSYNLRGLNGNKCPECGAITNSDVQESKK